MMDASVLSALSNEQLKELPYLVASELITRGLVKSAKLGGGRYVVGRDIPTGSYKIKNTDGYAVELIVNDAYGKEIYNYTLWDKDNETGRLDFNGGDEVTVDSNCAIYVWSGLFWE